METERITFQDGILESQEPSTVPKGFLTECVNWVPEPTGGLRVRARWFKGSTTGAPVTRRCKGIGLFSRYTDPAVVQMTPVVQFDPSSSTTPVFSWPTPTSIGNTLIAFIALTRESTAGTTTVTATGWTARQAISGNTQQQAGVYDILPTTVSYQGDVTPFTFVHSGSGASVTAWIVEVSGVAAVDVTDVETATSTSVTPLTSSTTQASSIVFALDSTRRASSTTAFTLSTATANWTEYAEAGRTSSFSYQEAAIYYGVRRTTGTQTLTITSTVSVLHSAYLIAYKGWNSASSPTDIVSSYLAADDNTLTYDIYAIDRANLSAGACSIVDAALGSTTTGAPVAFTMGLGGCYYTSVSFTGIRQYVGTTPSTVAGSPVGARCIAINKERLWAAGTPGNPSRLYFSQVGDASTWSGRGTGYFDISRDDGETIEDITPFANGLVIGKRTTLWFLAGDNTDQFQLVPLEGGGAAPGRSILATPYGCVIAGLEQVWLFDGQSVTPIGRAIEASYSVAEDAFVSLSYIDGSIYIATGADVFVFNLDAGVWRTERVGDGTGESPAIMYNYGDTQLMGPLAGTEGSLLNFRTFPHPTRGKDFDALTETFIAQTGDVAFGGSRLPLTPRQLYVQLRQRAGGATETGLVITPVQDGVLQNNCDVGAENPGVRRQVVQGFSQGKTSMTLGVRVEQEIPTGQSSTFDIEDMWLDFIAEGPRA